MRKLPVLISIPHGGTVIPDELKEYVCLSKQNLFNDSDAFTKDIYSIGQNAEVIVSADVARAFVDVNRSKDDLPPVNPDGVVKTHTCFNNQIYESGFKWNKTLIETLFKNYYEPYHASLNKVVQTPNIRLALDCHSMATVGPSISPDIGKKRSSLICLGNINGKSCDNKTTEKLAECFRKVFSLKEKEVKINSPFSGGYITHTYGMNPVPWIQIEMNRILYLNAPWFNYKTLKIDNKRLRKLNRMFETTLQMFFN